MTPRSFLVIGAGLVGAASALRLRDAGFDVTLIDPGDTRRGASFGNAGHIAVEQCEPLASGRNLSRFGRQLFAFGGPLDFRWSDALLWGPWAARFAAACNAERFAAGTRALSALTRDALGAWRRLTDLASMHDFVRPSGHVVLWMKQNNATRGIEAWRKANIGAATFRELTLGELDAYGAALKHAPAAGIRFSGSGQVADPQGLRDALLAAFTKHGGTICSAQARRLVARAEGASMELTNGMRIDAHAVLVSAGAWSSALLRNLGVRAPLVGERGYSIQSVEHAWPANFPPTVFEERALALTRFTSGLRASSFVEFGKPDASGDARKWRALETHLRGLGVAFSPTPQRWVGPRPTLPDYLPAIGRLARYPNVHYAFGHQHLGLTLAAVTAELIAQIASGSTPQIDIAPFRLERFA